MVRTVPERRTTPATPVGRQCVDDPAWRVISDEINDIIDRLLLERISLAGIARVVQVSESRLQAYGNEKYADQPRQVHV